MSAPQGARPQRVFWGAGSSRTLRGHWALAELELPYRREPIGARTGETGTEAFGRLNPRRKIPVLEDDGLVLTESPAIVAYLCERYPGPGTTLFPSDVASRARYYEWMSFISMELDATSLYVLRRHEHLPAIYGEAPTAVASARQYFTRMVEAAATIADHGRDYLLGDHFSGVDILMTTCLEWAARYGLPLPDAFDDYRARCTARGAYLAALTANELP